MRLTRQRKDILNILKQSGKPLSAEAIHGQLPHGSLNLSTIYRNLDYFHNLGHLGKSVLEGRSYYYLATGEHHHFMICRTCQTMVPIDCQIDQLTKDVAKKAQFTITDHDLAIYGYCRNCADKSNTQGE